MYVLYNTLDNRDCLITRHTVRIYVHKLYTYHSQSVLQMTQSLDDSLNNLLEWTANLTQIYKTTRNIYNRFNFF